MTIVPTRPSWEAAIPAEIPVEIPLEIPAESPVEAPGELPLEMPGESPLEVPGELPIEVPGTPVGMSALPVPRSLCAAPSSFPYPNLDFPNLDRYVRYRGIGP